MNYLYIIFLIIEVFSIIELFYKWTLVTTQKKEFTVYLTPSYWGCIFSCLVTSIFTITNNKLLALICYELNFFFLDIIVFGVYLFTKSYTQNNKRKLWQKILGIALLSVDVLLIVSNTHHKQYFDIVKRQVGNLNLMYWSLSIKPAMYFHYLLCAIIVIHACYNLLKKTIEVSHIYKKKYYVFLITYIISVITSYLSNILDLPQDYAVYMYPFMSNIAFIYTLIKTDEEIKIQANKNIIQNFTLGVCWFNKENKFVYSNSAADEIIKSLNLSKNDIEQYLKEFIKKNYARTLKVATATETFIIDGKKRFFTVTYKKIYEENECIGSYLNFRDETDQIEKNNQDSKKTLMDPLTGIYDRTQFFDVANEKLKKFSDKKWFMICSEIKDFKIISSIYGKEISNNLLITQAETLKKNCSPNSVYGRIIDDKFGLLVMQDEYDESFLLEKVIDVAKVTNNQYYHLNLQIGVYESTEVTEKAEYMFDKATMAIDSDIAKKDGRISYYNDLIMKKFLENRSIVTDFDYAYNASQFLLFLRPIVNKKNNIVSAEAVVKWNKPDTGLLTEEQFKPLIDKTIMIYRLDRYIWEKSMQQLSRWNKMGLDYIGITVGISVDDIYYSNIVEEFETLKNNYDFNPKKLKLNFDEDVFLKVPEKIMGIFSQLHEAGFEIGIKNFGMKHFDFSMLTCDNIDSIDYSMERIETFQKKDIDVTMNIVRFLKKLSYKILINNITDESLFQTMKKLDFDFYKGDFIGEPLSRLEFEQKYL